MTITASTITHHYNPFIISYNNYNDYDNARNGITSPLDGAFKKKGLVWLKLNFHKFKREQKHVGVSSRFNTWLRPFTWAWY